VSSFFNRLWTAASERWQEESARGGRWTATSQAARKLYGFLRDSTPQRRRSRYGDMDYDWEHRVNTTSGSVGWRERLLGVFHSPYQPTDAALFREMMASLPVDFSQFTFVDLGSGKGRTLLMASEYPFRRIVGVEILPELDRAAQENIRAFKSPAQRCMRIESICSDARAFVLPEEPLVLYLFNPLPEAALRQVLGTLERSPSALWIVYHNPLLEGVLAETGWLETAGRTERYVVYRRGHSPLRENAGIGVG
jgi:SAM-dependent methyltransferase